MGSSVILVNLSEHLYSNTHIWVFPLLYLPISITLSFETTSFQITWFHIMIFCLHIFQASSPLYISARVDVMISRQMLLKLATIYQILPLHSIKSTTGKQSQPVGHMQFPVFQDHNFSNKKKVNFSGMVFDIFFKNKGENQNVRFPRSSHFPFSALILS